MADAPFSLKQGATFRLSGTATQDSGAVFDLTGATLSAKLRDAGDALVETLTATVVSASGGTFTLTAASTTAWPPGLLRGDIKIVASGGSITFSETFTVRVERPVTRT